MASAHEDRIRELAESNARLASEIAERKRAEGALRESEERYRAVAEDTPVLICRFLPGGEITYVNKAYCEYFRSTPEQLVGSSFLSLIPEENRKAVLARISALAVESPTESLEHPVIAPGGEVRWQRWTNRALFNDQGAAAAYQAIGEDITDRKKTEKDMREIEERFRLAVAATCDGLWNWDLGTGEEWWSEQFRELIGYSESELPSTFESWKSLIHPSDRTRTLEAVRRHFEENQPYDLEYRLKTKTRGYCWFQACGATVKGADGKAKSMAGSLRDITDRKRAETALRVADRLSSIGTMVAGVAHEINSPLTAILGLSELMAKDSTLNRQTRQNADEIVAQAVRAAKIVKDLLGMARIGRIANETVQINRLIQRSLKHLRDSHRFDGVEIVEDYDNHLPETYADPYRLEQVFVNIIRNAGDALREVTAIRRLTVRTERSGDQIRLLFTDTGQGMEAPARVFDPFYTTKDAGEGAGLGLSVSLGIIRDHGGDITLETFNGSTQFLVTLPIRRNPDSDGKK